MGISRYTAYTIQSSDARAEAIACKDGKYQGLVNIYHDGFFHTTILSTQESVYDTREAAINDMQKTIDLVRTTDLSVDKN